MKSQRLLRVAGLLLGLSLFTIPLTAQPEERGVGLANPEEPVVLKGLRGGSQMIGAKDIRISDCVLDSLNIVSCQRLTIESSVIRGYANLLADQSLTVRNCEFYGGVAWDTTGGGSALFEHNVFVLPLFLRAATDSFRRPTIIGNSFVGPFQAVEVQDLSSVWTTYANLKLPLAGNYWGTSAGPSYPGGPIIEWLEPKGAFCQHWDGKETYLPSGFVTTAGGVVDAHRPHPLVWVQAARAGQNVLGTTLGHSTEILARPGRDLLVCFDLKASRSGYAPRFALLCNGKALPPKGGDTFTVERFYAAIAEGGDNHQRTLNFVVPAGQVTGPKMDLKLEMDARELGGYAQAGEKRTLWEATLQLKSSFTRKLRIGVAAVDLKIPFWITGTGIPTATESQLQEDLEALWPMTPDEYDIVKVPPIAITRGYLRGALQVATGGIWLTTALTRSATTYVQAWNASHPSDRLDRLVCVLPGDALDTVVQAVVGGHNEGAFQNLYGMYDTVCFVDEYNSRAAVHELGHAIGLNRGRDEQYTYWFFDKHGNRVDNGDGAFLRNVTIFNPVRRSLNGNASLIHHIGPYPASGRRIYDFMGAKEPQWVISSSLEEVYRALYGILGARAAVGAALAAGSPQASSQSGPGLMGPPPAGHRRVLFTGALRRYQDRNTLAYSYRVYPDTVRVRDVGGEEFNLTEGNRATLQYIECFNANGEAVAPRIPIVASLPDPAVPPVDPVWLQVVDFPIATTRLAITDQELQGFEFLSLADDGLAFQAQLGATPAAGALTGTLTLNLGHSPGTKSVPVFYQPYYSADGRNTWVPIGELTTETTVTVDARDLPAAENLTLRLVAADAFRSARAELTGFRVANRAPVVEVESPQSGDAASPTATWFLAAKVFDLEDGLIRTGEWQSSRDGLLGTNAVLPEVRLSAGVHTLTFTATDQLGLAGVASVQVRSGSVTEVDLAVEDDALRIGVAGVDPTVALPNRLQTGRLNQIRVAVRNGGLTNEARLSLFLTLEHAAEQLLASQVLTNWAPFALGSLEATYVYPGAGQYSLRAVVSDTRVLDPNPANNFRSWAFSNQPPVAAPARFDVTPQTALDLVLSGFDPDGDPLEYRLVNGPTRGVLERGGDAWRYRPMNAGQDSFTFTVSDGRFESAPAAVTFFTSTTAAPVPVPPSIVSADRVLATSGADFTHAVVVTAPPASFAAYGLPTGLQINPSTGLISGRTAEPGEFAVFVEAGKGGAIATQELKLRVQDTFARWIAKFGLTGADAAPEADPEADGVANLEEYAHQSNPTLQDALGAVKPSLLREALGRLREVDYFVVTYRQRKGGVGNPAVDYAVDGVRYRLEYVENLDEPRAWASGDRLFEALESRRVDNGDGTEWISVKCQIPTTYTLRGYVRLRITNP